MYIVLHSFSSLLSVIGQVIIGSSLENVALFNILYDYYNAVNVSVHRGHPELSSFSRAYGGREGARSHCTHIKNVVYGSENLHFQSTLLVCRERGGHKKEYSVYARDNDDNSGSS